MFLRKLEQSDAGFMLEWMLDKGLTENLMADFQNKKLEDCKNFIKNALMDETKNMHRAVCSEDNEYLGTVSLKNIDYEAGNAEFAIALRRKAVGNGTASFATKQILKTAFEELHLSRIYLCVASSNRRAIKFYNKFGFVQEGCFREHVYISKQKQDLLWYSITKDEFLCLNQK